MIWLFYIIYPIIVFLSWTIIVKVFPSILGKSVENYIQHRLDKRLEEFKADIQASYSTVMKSADLLPSLQAERLPRAIQSTETLWNNVIIFNNTYGELIFLDDILLPSEIDEDIISRNNRYIWEILSKYEKNSFMNEQAIEIGKLTHGEQRLFVGDKLWIIYMTIYRFYGRFAWLMHWSIKENKYRNWKEDDAFLSILRVVLPENIINDAMARQLGGLRTILIYLQGKFLDEARRVMSGSDGLSESFSDIQGILKSATADILVERERRGMNNS